MHLPFTTRQDPIQKRILTVVCTIHLLFAFWIMTSHNFAKPKKIHKPLIVKTITPRPVGGMHVAESKKAAPAKKVAAPPKTEVKTEIPLPKEAPVAPIAKKVEPPTKKEGAVKKDPAIQDKTLSKNAPLPAKKNMPPPPPRAKVSEDLYKSLEESIAKIDAKRDKVYAKTAPSPLKLAPLQIDAHVDGGGNETVGEMDYVDSLVSYLHQSLSLPEFGEVKIQLTVRQDGTVAKLVVIKTESEKNKKYLEANLPRLKFPRFEKNYSTKKDCTFTLTFCNET